MAKTKIGKVGLTPKKEYSPIFSYKRLDVVTKDGSSYICLKDCVEIDVTNTEYWQLSASKGDKPKNGIDYNTTEEKETFKNEVVEYAEQEIDTYIETKEQSLDTYTTTKKEELDIKEIALEKDLTDKKGSLIEEMQTAQNGFDKNVTTKTTEFNSNVTEKTNTFNQNAVEKTNEFNSNAEQKTEDFNTNAESYNNRIKQLEVKVDKMNFFDSIYSLFRNTSINISTGTWQKTNTNRLAFEIPQLATDDLLLKIDNNFEFSVQYWKSNRTGQDEILKSTDFYNEWFINKGTYFTVVIRHYGKEQRIYPEQAKNLIGYYNTYLKILKIDNIIKYLSPFNLNVYDSFTNLVLSGSTGGYIIGGNTRIGINKILYVEDDVVINANEGFNIGIQLFRTCEFGIDSYISDSGWKSGSVTIPRGSYFSFIVRHTDDSTIYPHEGYNIQAYYKKVSFYDLETNTDFGNIKSINHRGYCNVAPENTLSAYKLSKKMGYRYVETDVSFTSDNIPVLLHDNTIDRTSNGSGSITSMTFEQVRQYDFGSWKFSNYAGEKIPSFEEFITLCKNIGLHPYIELKNNVTYTENQIKQVVDIVKKYGMINKCTWISFNATYLQYVKNNIDKGRLGYIANLTQENIQTALSLKTNTIEVFMDSQCNIDTNNNPDNIQMCIENDLPLEMWTVNTLDGVKALPNYVTGVTTNNLNIGKILLENNI